MRAPRTPIARVGNSGSSAEPHLEVQIQNEPTFKVSRSSLRTYPMLFRDVVVTRRGEEDTPAKADVRRGDRIRPEVLRRAKCDVVVVH